MHAGPRGSGRSASGWPAGCGARASRSSVVESSPPTAASGGQQAEARPRTDAERAASRRARAPTTPRPNITLKVRITSASVRTAAWRHQPAQPVGDVATQMACRRPPAPRPWASRSAQTSTTPSADADRLGDERAAPCRRRTGSAPIGGPASWLIVISAGHAGARWRSRDRRGAPASAAGSGWSLSANTSATPIRNIATSTDRDADPPGDDRDGEQEQDDRPAARHRPPPSAAGRAGRRARRRTGRRPATAAAGARPASATRNGLCVCDATSSGPAARASPSPGCSPTTTPAASGSSVPRRGGATASSTGARELLTRT